MGASKMKRKIIVSILLAMSLMTISCARGNGGNYINDNNEFTDDSQDDYDRLSESLSLYLSNF